MRSHFQKVRKERERETNENRNEINRQDDTMKYNYITRMSHKIASK